MVSTEEKARLSLTEWTNIMADVTKLQTITYLAPGSRSGESMVTTHLLRACQDIQESFPEARQIIYTTTADVDGWPESYVLPNNPDIIEVVDKGVATAMAAYVEGGLRADVIITSDLAPAFAAYGLERGFMFMPPSPVIIVFPKVPEKNLDDNVSLDIRRATHMVRYMAHLSTAWFVVLDNAAEERAMQTLLDDAGAYGLDRVRRFSTYAFNGSPWPPRRDVVVWSGRQSRAKQAELAAQIFSLLGSVKCEVFIPASGRRPSSAWRVLTDKPNFELHIGLPSNAYRELAGTAKVLLVTSSVEGYAIGYLELMGTGVLPVVFNATWADDLLPPGWPFRFRTAGEGASMVLEALAQYDNYAPVLRAWMQQRFGQRRRMDTILQEAWQDYAIRYAERWRIKVPRRPGHRCR